MAKFWDFSIKNIKTVFRDRKMWLFIFLIPIFYYSLMGGIFGRMNSDLTGTTYTIGFVNLDSSSSVSANVSDRPNLNDNFIYNTINNLKSYRLENFTTLKDAQFNLTSNKLNAIMVIPNGFQSYLANSSIIKYAFYNNDSSSNIPENNTNSLNYFIQIASQFDDITNVTDQNFHIFLNNFNSSNFDYLILFQQNFLANLNNLTVAHITLYYRNGINIENALIQNTLLRSLLNSIIFKNDFARQHSDIIFKDKAIQNTSPKPIPKILFYFRNSADPTLKLIISTTLESMINGIVNYNPNAIPLSYNEESVSGRYLNVLTVGTPGYVMYGLLSLLPMATVLITSEKKSGILKRLETSQMKSSDLLLGNIVSNTLILIIQFIIGIAVLMLFGFTPLFANIFSLIIGVAITLIILSILLNSLSLTASALFKTPEASAGGILLFLIPLMTFSGAFFPLELIAPNLVPYVGWIPTRIVVILFQDIFVNGMAITNLTLWINFGWLALENLIIFVIGLKLYNRFVRS